MNKLNHWIFDFDLFSTPISIFATSRTAKNPRQFHGSYIGIVLTAISCLSLATYFSYLSTRMNNSSDDRYNTLELVNTFQDGQNQFMLKDFDFLYIFELYFFNNEE